MLSVPGLAEFVFQSPLYEDIDLGEGWLDFYFQLRATAHRIDGYCPECKESATYIHSVSDLIKSRKGNNLFKTTGSTEEEPIKDYKFSEMWFCSRNTDHEIKIYFRFDKTTIIKIGQWPSIAVLEFGRFKKYKD